MLSPLLEVWANLSRKARIISFSVFFVCFGLYHSTLEYQAQLQESNSFPTQPKNLREDQATIPVGVPGEDEEVKKITNENPPVGQEISEHAKALELPSEEVRKNCQIVYIVAVEGAAHHGFEPVLEALARNQKDDDGNAFDVSYKSKEIQRALFGLFGGIKLGNMDDPKVIGRTISALCPKDGRKHVIIEDSSFPSGHVDDLRTYRVKRQMEWAHLSMEEIADSEVALNHPFNLSTFYEAYSPYADIKFVVLHRPFLETIASHTDWDEGVEGHSNVVRGFMLLLRRFLDSHILDERTGRKLWTLVCIEKIFAKTYEFNNNKVETARKRMIVHVARFLSWTNTDCPHCFDSWKESTKDHYAVLGKETVAVVEDHMKSLDGIWPPVDDNAVWKECQM